jgi:hypothetical protein
MYKYIHTLIMHISTQIHKIYTHKIVYTLYYTYILVLVLIYMPKLATKEQVV